MSLPKAGRFDRARVAFEKAKGKAYGRFLTPGTCPVTERIAVGGEVRVSAPCGARLSGLEHRRGRSVWISYECPEGHTFDAYGYASEPLEAFAKTDPDAFAAEHWMELEP